jgi:hypothetical protein
MRLVLVQCDLCRWFIVEGIVVHVSWVVQCVYACVICQSLIHGYFLPGPVRLLFRYYLTFLSAEAYGIGPP